MLRPLNDKVVLKPLEERYRGLIIIPDNAKKERPMRGRVIAAGPGMLKKDGSRWPMPDIESGDVVIFTPTGSSDVTVEDEHYVIVRDAMIIGVIEEDLRGQGYEEASP